MQAVILAAGRGVRMNNLTSENPKPLLTVCGKSLIEHKLDILPLSVGEAVIVVGYLGEKIKNRIGVNYNGMPIRYIWQKEPLGTAHALFEAKKALSGDFLVMMGDDLYEKSDLERMLNSNWAMLVYKSDSSFRGARVEFLNGRVLSVTESQEIKAGDFINTGCYVLDKEIFNYPLVKLPGREEFGLPQTIVQSIGRRELETVPASRWVPVTTPEDLNKAADFLNSVLK